MAHSTNNFTKKTRLLFLWMRNCFLCKSNQSLELDHILGRISNSPLNASMICRKCHVDKALRGHEGKIKQLKITLDFLRNEKYELNKKDQMFYMKAREYYENSRY